MVKSKLLKKLIFDAFALALRLQLVDVDDPLRLHDFVVVRVDLPFEFGAAILHHLEGIDQRHGDIFPFVRLDFVYQLVNRRHGRIRTFHHSWAQIFARFVLLRGRYQGPIRLSVCNSFLEDGRADPANWRDRHRLVLSLMLSVGRWRLR